MTTTRRFISIFVLFSTYLTLHAQTTAPLSIRQPFEALSKAQNETLMQIDQFMTTVQWSAPLDSALSVELTAIMTRLNALSDITQPRIALPLAIARIFKANDLALYEDFDEVIRLCDLAIEPLDAFTKETKEQLVKDTSGIYALGMAHAIKAYAWEYLFDLEEAVLQRNQAIEAFKRINYEQFELSERLNKARLFLDMGDDKAGLAELARYDTIKQRYNYAKGDLFATVVQAGFWLNIADRNAQLGEPEMAQKVYTQAFNALEKTYKDIEKNEKDFSPEELAAAKHKVNSFSALVYLNGTSEKKADSALAYINRVNLPQRGSTVINDNIIKSRAYLMKGDFEQSKSYIQEALRTLIDPKTDVKDIFSTPSVLVRNITFLQLAASCYFQKGELLSRMYDASKGRKQTEIQYLIHSFYCFRQATAAIDTLRMNFSTDATMRNVVKQFSKMYPTIVLTAGRLYQETNNPAYLDTMLQMQPKRKSNAQLIPNNSAYLDSMLRISEQYKAFALRQTIYTRTNRERYAGKTLELYNEEQRLKRNLILAQNALGLNDNTENLKKLNAAQANYHQFKENLKKMPVNTEGGRYYAERFADSVPTIKDIQHDWLKSKTGDVPRVFLSFTFSPTHIIALLITPDKAQPYIRETPAQFWSLLKRFNTSIELETTFPNAAAYQLYETLLKDVLLDVPKDAHLIISAEGPLLRLPFEALLTQPIDSKDNDYPKMPFLIKKHRVSYVPSLTTQMWLRTFHAAAKPTQQRIGIVKGYYQKSENFMAPLIAAADSVAYFYNKSATVFNNDDKMPFMPDEKEALDFTDLFFAVHGEANASNPLDYSLLLRDNITKTEDSTLMRLTVAKIQRLTFKKLNSVVFGACETQHGELDLGEGMFSIARAFQGLGCRHIVCNLNSVSIESTARLLNNFYQHFKRKSLSEALHQTKIDYLSAKTIDREIKHPYYWANLIYLGDD